MCSSDLLTLNHRLCVGPESLTNGNQCGLKLPTQHGAHAQSAQQRLVHGGVEAVDAEVGLRGELLDAGQGFDRNAGRGMHAHVKRHQARILQSLGIELLERKIDAAHREALALQPRGRLGQGERLPPQLIGVDEDDLERVGYFDFGRCSNGAGPGSRLAPASARRLR